MKPKIIQFLCWLGDIFLYPTYNELILPAKSSKTWILLKLITDSQLVFFYKYGQFGRTFLLLDQLILWCNYLLVKCEHNFYCTILSFLWHHHYELEQKLSNIFSHYKKPCIFCLLYTSPSPRD